MPKFSYRGTNEQGQERSGEVEAPGVVEAAASLRAQGVWASTLERVERPPPEEMQGEADAFVFFNRSLAQMVRLGFPLSRAIGEISRGLGRGRFKRTLLRLEDLVREGKSLEAAVAEMPGDFPPHYRFMVEAGISSGNLPSVLSAVARNSEGFRRAKKAMVGALAYPAVVLITAALLLTAFLIAFVPLYRDVYRNYSPSPSLPRSFILTLVGSVGIPLGAAATLVLLLALAGLWMRRTASGERFLFRLPLLGRILKNLLVARFSGCLAVLLRARTPLSKALPVALGAASSLALDRALPRLQARASEGAALGEILKEAPVIPPEMAAYFALAERGSRIPEAAEELSGMLTEQALRESDTLFFVLFPLSIAATGLLLGALLISLVLPFFRFLEGLVR